MKRLLHAVITWLKQFWNPPYYPTPPYPVSAWNELPEECWPEGYDPVTDTFPLGDPKKSPPLPTDPAPEGGHDSAHLRVKVGNVDRAQALAEEGEAKGVLPGSQL